MALTLRVAAAAALFCLSMPLTASAAGPTFPAWMSNGLYRQMSEKERAYFGKPLAEVVQAMSKGNCVAELSSGEPADASKPSGWLRDQGKLTPAGLAPSSWEVPVRCGQIRAVVTLSPVTLAVVPEPGDKPMGAGADVFSTAGKLVIGDFVLGTAKMSAPAESTKEANVAALGEVPSLAKPVAIQIRADRAGRDLSDLVDIAAARSVLNNMPPPPPRSPPAVESDEQLGDEEMVRQTEASIISYLAGRAGPRKKVVIAETTWKGGLPAESEQVLPTLAPEILGSAISSYRERNRISKPIPAEVKVPGSQVVLVSEGALRSYFQKGSEAQGWAKFSQAYGDPQLLTFSRVGLSHDLSQAVIFQGYQGARIATGSLLFLRREADTWRVMYTLRLWVE